MAVMQIAFATDAAHPDLTEGDKLLMEPLSQRSIVVHGAVWDDPTVRWEDFAGVVIRSTWDYHEHPEAFRAWLDDLERCGVSVWNPPALVRWNMDKGYLSDLRDSGVSVLPTVWLEEGDKADLAELLDAHGWDQAVVKPRVGASAYRTWRIDRNSAAGDQSRFSEALEQGGLMVQRFAEQIRQGEISFMFFDGVYSHAVLKTPAEHSIFVQSEHGGSQESMQPDAALIAQAEAVLTSAQKITGVPALYARVDTLLDGHQLVLMELELIEPDLFLSYDAQGVQRFAEAIAAQLA
jgi:glutathione synthase/RimK-type ligase-like ATP-grasp enzyme